MRRRATSVTSSTARLNAASLVRDGLEVPLSLRTNCSADARISSSVAGGAKLASVLMLRHIGRALADGHARKLARGELVALPRCFPSAGLIECPAQKERIFLRIIDGYDE